MSWSGVLRRSMSTALRGRCRDRRSPRCRRRSSRPWRASRRGRSRGAQTSIVSPSAHGHLADALAFEPRRQALALVAAQEQRPVLDDAAAAEGALGLLEPGFELLGRQVEVLDAGALLAAVTLALVAHDGTLGPAGPRGLGG